MNIAQLANYLGTNPSNAKCLMMAPGFPSFKLGRQLIVTDEALDRWLDRHTGESFPAKSKPKTSFKRNRRGQYPMCSSFMEV